MSGGACRQTTLDVRLKTFLGHNLHRFWTQPGWKICIGHWSLSYYLLVSIFHWYQRTAGHIEFEYLTLICKKHFHRPNLIMFSDNGGRNKAFNNKMTQQFIERAEVWYF